jgi:hypothetical protein
MQQVQSIEFVASVFVFNNLPSVFAQRAAQPIDAPSQPANVGETPLEFSNTDVLLKEFETLPS